MILPYYLFSIYIFCIIYDYENDIFEVISNLHVKGTKFGGKIYKFCEKKSWTPRSSWSFFFQVWQHYVAYRTLNGVLHTAQHTIDWTLQNNYNPRCNKKKVCLLQSFSVHKICLVVTGEDYRIPLNVGHCTAHYMVYCKLKGVLHTKWRNAHCRAHYILHTATYLET